MAGNPPTTRQKAIWDFKGSAEEGASQLGRGLGGVRPQESGVAPANQTKERSAHELFAGAFRNKSSM